MACPPLLATVLGIVVISLLHLRTSSNYALTMRAVMVALWPAILLSLLDPEDHGDLAIIPSLLWMLVVWAVDSYSLLTGTSRGVRIEPSTITALSFGLCGLVGARADSKYVHLVVYGLLLCVMFVLPTHNVPKDDPLCDVLDELQRGILVWAIALVITGISLTRRQACVPQRPIM